MFISFDFTENIQKKGNGMARLIGFEPTACRLGGDRSIRLSYKRLLFYYTILKPKNQASEDTMKRKSYRLSDQTGHRLSQNPALVIVGSFFP